MFKVVQRCMGTLTQTRALREAPIGIIGAPLGKGTGKTKSGVVNGPSALRKRGLLEDLRSSGINVRDFGDLEFADIHEDIVAGKTKFPHSVSAACQLLSKTVQTVLKDDRRCLTIGGDHSIGMATIHGHAQVRPDMCVLWVDAHSDINTELTSLSGHVNGMPLSFLIREMKNYQRNKSAFSWVEPCIGRENISYIGLRDIDPLEKVILEEQNILCFTMADIDRLGIIETTNRALDAINPTGKKSLHVSFDIDVIDKSFAASTGVPVYGGLTLREVYCLAEEINKRGMPAAIDVVEVDPSIGTEQNVDATVTMAYEITKALLGFQRDSLYLKKQNSESKPL